MPVLRSRTDRRIADSARRFSGGVTDKLGSIRSWIAQDGTWDARSRYGPWGTTLIKNLGATDRFPYRWAGRELDKETGFYYLRARYYDPRQGRFTQEDPIGLAGGRNLYAYVDGQPLEARDPTGLWRDQGLNDPCPWECGGHLGGDGWIGWFGLGEMLGPNEPLRNFGFVGATDEEIAMFWQLAVTSDRFLQFVAAFDASHVQLVVSIMDESLFDLYGMPGYTMILDQNGKEIALPGTGPRTFDERTLGKVLIQISRSDLQREDVGRKIRSLGGLPTMQNEFAHEMAHAYHALSRGWYDFEKLAHRQEREVIRAYNRAMRAFR